VRAAAAQVRVECRAHLRLGRMRHAREQGRCADEDPREAIAALARLLGEKGLLQCAHGPVRCQPFHGDDGLVLHGADRRVAGRHRHAVHQHMAGPAFAGSAAEARALQAAVVAQHVQQRRVLVRLHGALAAVDAQAQVRDAHEEIPLRAKARRGIITDAGRAPVRCAP
jgi:hypothetical protein